MNEITKIEEEIKTDYAKFAHFVRTLELKLFGGILHQKAVNPAPAVEPTHVWVPVDSHDGPAPKPGEPVTEPVVTSTSTSTGGVVTSTSTTESAAIAGATTITTSTASNT